MSRIMALLVGTAVAGPAQAQSWSDFAEAFPLLPCHDGWAACIVDGDHVDPGLVSDSTGMPTPASMRVGWFDLKPTPTFSPFSSLSAYTGEAPAQMAAADVAPEPEAIPEPEIVLEVAVLDAAGENAVAEAAAAADAERAAEKDSLAAERAAADAAASQAAADREQEAASRRQAEAKAEAAAQVKRQKELEAAAAAAGAEEKVRLQKEAAAAKAQAEAAAKAQAEAEAERKAAEASAKAKAVEAERLKRESAAKAAAEAEAKRVSEQKAAAEAAAHEKAEAEARKKDEEAAAKRKAEAEAKAKADAEAAAAAGEEGGDGVAAASIAPPPAASGGGCELDKLVRLEPQAMLGRMDDPTVAACENTLASTPKMTDKGKVSRILMVNAFAKGDKATWETLAKRHLDEIDQSDPNLCYKYALHLSKQGSGRASGVIRWSDVARENRTVWTGDTYTSRVNSLYKLRAAAAQKLWAKAEESHATEASESTSSKVDKYRAMTKVMSREWYEYAKVAGKDTTKALQLCMSAAGTKDYCEAG